MLQLVPLGFIWQPVAAASTDFPDNISTSATQLEYFQVEISINIFSGNAPTGSPGLYLATGCRCLT